LENNLWSTSFKREIEVGILTIIESGEEECGNGLKEDVEVGDMTVGVVLLRR
jgi:hypothetical protein